MMRQDFADPYLADEGVFFTVMTDSEERKCLVSRNALAYLSRAQGHTMSFMNTYAAFEAKIHNVARRLVVAGESTSPLILGAAYFIDAAVPPAS